MKNNKILVIGRYGQLAQSIYENQTKENLYFLGSKELDLRNLSQIKSQLSEVQPEIIINCSAFNNVDEAENEISDNRLINIEAIKELVAYCKESKSKLIHISTDYVFDGQKKTPYEEDDSPNPINKYGEAKLDAENYISKNLNNFFILRTSWLYSHFITNSNFLHRIINNLNTKKEIYGTKDIFGTPTYSDDLAKIILSIIKRGDWDKCGTYHASNFGEISRYEFINEINKHFLLYTSRKIKIIPVKAMQFKQEAKRPKYSVLSSKKISNDLDIEIMDWKKSLSIACKRYLKNFNC